MRKLDLVKNRTVHPPVVINQADQVKAIESVKSSIDDLYQAFNDKEEYDFDKLSEQLKALNETLDLKEQLKDLKQAVKDSKTDRVEIDKFNDLLKAVKDNKPLPVKVDLSKLEKAIIQVQQRIQESDVIDQAPAEFQPVRRVVKIGNRLIFDDQPTPSSRAGGGGGGSTSSTGLTDAELRASAVPVSGTFFQATQPVSGTFWQATQPVSGTVTATPTGTYTTKETRSATPSQSSVADTASSTTLLASNSNRLGATIFNDSTVALYVKLGATASTTSFTIKLDAQDYYEVPFGYTGIIDGIWASDASGSARITELT